MAPAALLLWAVPALLGTDPPAPGAKAPGEPAAKAAGGAEGAVVADAGRAAPTPRDVDMETSGVRSRIVLRRGVTVEGVLPSGKAWEKPLEGGGYGPAAGDEASAGLRVRFVMGMEGEIFLRKADIVEVREVGGMSEADQDALRQKILDERRRVLEEKEKEIARLLREIRGAEETARAAPAAEGRTTAKAGSGSPGAAGAAAEAAAEAAAGSTATEAAPAKAPAAGAAGGKDTSEEGLRRKGDDLLARFPPPDWSEERANTIYNRRKIARIEPDEREAEFLDGYALWEAALLRRQAREAAEKEKGDVRN